MNYDVLIRCYNEVNWLPITKKALDDQLSQPSNVIFVDSGSNDGSRELAKSYGWQVIDYQTKKFNYSESLNLGCSYSISDAILILSAHCILTGQESVKMMLKELIEDDEVCAVYGRQLPTSKSTPHDIRDLLTVFGRERLVFNQYPFFHNAFAMIRKESWQRFKFDETVNGIEDRVWARSLVKEGFKIVYQPKASVYHEHGLNHGTSDERAMRVVKALRSLHFDDNLIIWPEGS